MTQKIIPIMMSDQEGSESVIAKWFRQEGENINIHDPLVEISTDKVTIELSAPATGILHHIYKHENDPIAPNDVLGDILLLGEPTVRLDTRKNPIMPDKKQQVKETLTSTGDRKHLLSPAVRKLIRQHNLDVSKIKGSGKGGRVSHKDIEKYIKSLSSFPKKINEFDLLHPQATNNAISIEEKTVIDGEFIPHTQMRKKIASHMVESMLKLAPHVTAIFEVNMTNVIQHRHKHKSEFEKQGINLTFTSYFVKATVHALQSVPEINSKWHENALEVFNNCNIGIATALEHGLIVPVLKEAENLNLRGIAGKLQKIIGKARSGKAAPEDLQGGTFTITNHGVSGSIIATPIINQPQSAILGIGKMQKRVVVKEIHGVDTMQILPMLYVTLTIDHRALDGFQANKFLTAFVSYIEEGFQE